MLPKKTEEENRKFAAMTNVEKRVAIARDVLKALDAKQIVANGGQYVSEFGGGPWGFGPLSRFCGDESLREKLPELGTCHVCAKGAIFMCVVNARNEVKVSDVRDAIMSFWSGHGLSKALGDIFEPEQLDAIENEFEGYVVNGRQRPIMMLTRGYFYAGPYNSNNRVLTPEERMRIIMKNIVKNGGTFVPENPQKVSDWANDCTEKFTQWLNEEV